MGPEPDPNCPAPGAHIWGWMSPAELTWLYETAQTMDSICEIGVLRGRSCFALLKGCPGPVYAIDPWDDPTERCFPDFLADCGHFPTLRAIRGWSPGATEQVPAVDMTFIDGDHAYSSIMADIAAMLPKTRKLICGHDYQNADGGFPDVAVAVHELFDGRFFVAPDTAIWGVWL